MPIPVKEALRRHPGARPFRFGESNERNAWVLNLVKMGRKTMTCDAIDTYKARGDKIPVSGDVSVALYNHGLPALAIRTETVSLIPFDEMTEDLILPQGEFRDLSEWRASYEAFLTEADLFTPKVMMVVERFEVIELFP